jgi:hypothetical protein
MSQQTAKRVFRSKILNHERWMTTFRLPLGYDTVASDDPELQRLELLPVDGIGSRLVLSCKVSESPKNAAQNPRANSVCQTRANVDCNDRCAPTAIVMTNKTSVTAALLGVILGLSSALCAQPAKTPTLEEILDRLEAHLNHYDTSVPSLFCDEHVVSQVQPGDRDQNTITDSVFRLKRTSNPDHTTTLVESRDIKFVNGNPPSSQNLDGPTMLDGVFEGGLAVVSLSQTACMNYTLRRINRNRPTEPYLIRFSTVLTPQNITKCLLQENSRGNVLIDPASTQIKHIEITTPRHISGSGNSRFVAKRDLAVDYAPVLLGSETFWMPSMITMKVTSGSGSFHEIVWSFRASYSNYHKLEVKSRILPGSETRAR